MRNLVRLLLFAVVVAAVPAASHASTTEVFATNVDAGSPATDLRWDRYTPITGGPTWPVVIVAHGGGYKAGGRGPFFVAQDLANAGFLAFAIEYRLAPPHSAMNGAGPPGDPQADPPSDGRPPQQTDDVRAAIRAARADSHCNGKVALVGFSGGASHGAWWSISGTANDDRPDVLVGCSGVYDNDNADLLADATSKALIVNYLNLPFSDPGFHAAARASSAYWLTVTATPPPVLLLNSTAETVPQSIYSTMVTKMTNAGGTVESHLRTGTEHASDYWYLAYGGSFSTVKDCTIDFIQRMLTITPPPVVAPANIIIRGN